MDHKVIGLGVLAPTLLLLAGCSAGGAATPASTVTVTVTVDPEPQRASSGAVAPGQWQTVDGAKVRVIEISNEDAVASNQTPDAAALVETCAQGTELTPMWMTWAAADAEGGNYPGSSEMSGDTPKPVYPFAGERTLTDGECIKGWVVFGTAQNVNITTVSYISDTGKTTTWGS